MTQRNKKKLIDSTINCVKQNGGGLEINNIEKWSLTPGLSPYREVKEFLRIIKGVPYDLITQMRARIWEQVGTPQNNIDWTQPDKWIPERLEGLEKDLAMKIWRESGKSVNPRHIRGTWYFVKNHNLINEDQDRNIDITNDGKIFLNDEVNHVVTRIDRYEGLLNILQAISEHNPGKRSDILPAYIEFCNTYTNYRSESVYKSSLYDRVVNLIDRKLVERRGSVLFQITDKGINYLQSVTHAIPGRMINTKQNELNNLVRSITQEARQSLLGYLLHMDPTQFEHMVGLLLQEMGYSDIEVTSPSNDKGVDVIGDISFGISSVHEVVQVKRHSGSINRQIVDLLRGSLHRFNAIRGTIITTGTFSLGAKKASLERNAAPITLIDGEKLLDLLMQYEIGITKQNVAVFEFDQSKLRQFEDDREIEIIDN